MTFSGADMRAAVMPIAALRLEPHASFWWLLPFFVLSIGLVVYLYRSQRKLIAARTAKALTALRVGLILLLGVLFLQPTLAWNHTRTSDGELWFLIDQSPSMESHDPQSTATERLRWAEAAGYLPASARPSKLDVQAAAFTAVAGEFWTIRPSGATLSLPGDPAEELGRVSQLAGHLGTWKGELQRVQQGIAADPAASNGHVVTALHTMDLITSSLGNGIAAVKGATTLHEADLGVDWATISADLEHVTDDLTAAANETDAAFLRGHASDSDVATALSRIGGISRSDLANLFLTDAARREGVSIADLLKRYRVHLATFSDSAQTSPAIDAGSFPEALRNALAIGTSAHATNMTAGLQAIAEQIPVGQPGAVIIVSDGRHNTGGDPTEPARLLATRAGSAVPVFGLLVGSHEVSPDAAVEQVDAPDWIFKGDTLHAGAMIRLDGLADQTAHVELRRGDVVVDTRAVQVHSNQETQRLDFTDTPPPTGAAYEYEVRIAEIPGEVNTQNNHSTFRVAVKKEKLEALVIEDRPRWEFRYLAATLSRDQRVHLQTVVLHPATIDGVRAPAPVKASPANTHIEAQELPNSPEEWQAFDLIVIGDVPADTLSVPAQQSIGAAVRDKGATLITIAGQRHMPESFTNTPLADLLPVTLTPQFDQNTVTRHSRFGFRPGLAPEGNASVLGQLGLTPDANADLWSEIPLWYWHSPFTQAKPAASVLWSITEPGVGAGGIGATRTAALLATMPVGLGHSLYLASDQTWRLRQVFGNNVHERFWGQVLRWATGSDLPAGGKFVRFGSSQPTYTQGQPVTITARILREDLTPYTGLSFGAHAVPIVKGAATSARDAVDARFIESPDAPGYYHVTLGGLPAGDIELSLQGAEVERLLNNDPSVTQRTLQLKILPSLDVEQRNMNTDPPLLARVAQAGRGFSVDANDADILAAHLPAITRTETTPEQIGLFTDPNARGTKIAHWLFLFLFAAVLTTEWVLRKRAGLV